MHVLQDDSSDMNKQHIEGHSPRDGTPLPPVRTSTHKEIFDAVANCHEAARSWAALHPKQRARRLLRVKDRLLASAHELSELMLAEGGKSAVESYTSEILPSADLFAYWCKHGARFLRPERKALNPVNFPKKAGVLQLVPHGVVALIAPWNYPLALPLRTLVPALLAGNGVVFKPSEFSPRVGARIVELFAALEAPGLVQLVQGGAAVGATLVEAEVDHVVFTGSVASGRLVAKACADRLIGCSLELGGKDAAIVLEDADLERTVEGIVWGAFANAGQNCASIERVYVVKSIARPFVDAVVRRTQELVLGGAARVAFDIGPMIRPDGLKTVQRHIEDAVAHGATVRAGGQASGEGLHFQPTVLTDLHDDMAVLTEETFGPLLPIVEVDDADAAIEKANQSVFGLTASIWSRNLQRASELADKLETGVVTINNHAFTGALAHAPWHGRRHSGGGTTNSRFALYELTQPKFVLTDRATARELWWFPHNAVMLSMAQALATLLGKGGNKFRAVFTLVRSLPQRWTK